MISILIHEAENRLPPAIKKKLEGHGYDLQTTLVRWALVVAIIFISLAIVPLAVGGRRSAMLILLAFGAAFAGYILLRWSDLPLVVLIPSGLLVPFEIGTGTQTTLNISILLVGTALGLWIFKLIATRQSGIDRGKHLLAPALAILFSALISFGFGQFNWFPTQGASISAQIGALAIFILSVGGFLVTAFSLQRTSALAWMVGLYILICGIYMVGNVFPPLGNSVLHFYQRPPNDSMFWACFAALGFSQAVFNNRLKLHWRVIVGGLVALSLYIAWFYKQGWTSSWLPMVVAIAAVMFIAKPKLVIPGVLVIGALLVINSQMVTTEVMVGDNAYSMMTRLEAWKVLFNIIIANPIFGVGMANYYWYTVLFPILGYNVTFNSHNNYVDLIAQTGLIGLGVYVWFLISVGLYIWRSRFNVKEGFERAYIYGAFGLLCSGIVAGMLGDWIIPFIYNIGMSGFRASCLFWVFLGGAVAIIRRIQPLEEKQIAENSI